MTASDWWSRLTSEDRTDDELDSNTYVIYGERLFKIRSRNTSILREVKCGFSHFFSCAFILAVNPSLLQYAGFNPDRVAAGTAISAGVSCIVSGLFSNLPFVLAPTTSTSLYFALFMQNRNLATSDGSFSVFCLGLLLFLCGLRPVALFISNIIPFVIKVGICLGVGLLIALESLTEIGLVRSGDRTVLDIGEFNSEIYIAMIAFITIGIALHYKVRGAFLIGLVLGTTMYWLLALMEGQGHVSVTSEDIFVESKDIRFSFSGFTAHTMSQSVVYRLVFDLYVIGIILLNGLAHGLSEMAGIKREDGTLPRGKWLYAACGFGTLLSALLGSGPIMISPESAPGIKSGARTGLSTVVCGVLFLLSTILCPLFAKVPAAGTSPVLLMIGMMLFENAGKVNWNSVKEALPVFLMAVFIPFTYSIFNGVIFGFGIYSILYLCTEENAVPRVIRKMKRIVACCCCRGGGSGASSSSKKSSASGSNNNNSSGGGGGGGNIDGEYKSILLRDFDNDGDEDDGVVDHRGLTFELSEISNQYVEPEGDGDDIVSIRLSDQHFTGGRTNSSSGGSRASSVSSPASTVAANGRATTTPLRNPVTNSAALSGSSSNNNKKKWGEGGYTASPKVTAPLSNTTTASATTTAGGGGTSFLHSVWGPSSSSGGSGNNTRSVNAGAGSLLSMFGSSSRDDSNTPDWVLDSSPKL